MRIPRVLLASLVLAVSACANGEPSMAAPTAETLFSGSQAKLGQAIERGSLSGVEAALAAGADPAAPGAKGVTPLLFAAAQPDASAIVERLARAGGDPNHRDASGHSAVTLAVLAAHPAPGTQTDLGNITAVLAAGGDPNARFPVGDPALAWAVGQNNPELIRLLMKAGADANAATRTGDPVIVSAAVGAYWDAVLAMMQEGADWRVVSRGNSVPQALSRLGVAAGSPMHDAAMEVREMVEAEGFPLPAPSARDIGFASGRFGPSGFVQDE